MTTIYLAGPISGKSYHEVVSRYAVKIQELRKMGYRTLSPMTAKGYLRNDVKLKAVGYDNPVSTNHAIVNRDKWMVEKSDIVLADLTNAVEVSIGTVMELAWAFHFGKHVIVIMGESNIHQHAFVLEAAHIVFPKLEDAYNYLELLQVG